MLSLKHYRDRARGVADLLNWAALIDDGVVLGKDGMLISGWYFRGPDIASMTPAALNHLTVRINAALARLDGDWSLWIDAVRLPAMRYPASEQSAFPDPVSALIDDERRHHFLAEGAHYETEHALIVGYTPPLQKQTRLMQMFYEGRHEASLPPTDRQLASFEKAVTDIGEMLGDVLTMQRMRSFEFRDRHGRLHLRDELVNYFQFCLTGQLDGLNIPPCPIYLDALLGGQDMQAGDALKVGETYCRALAIEGFPHESFPLMLAVLDDVAVPYRFSTRFLPLDLPQALGELRKYRRQWQQQKRGFVEQMFRMQNGRINEDALLMEAQADQAMNDARSTQVSFGYYTPVILVSGPERRILDEQARQIIRQIRGLGFACRIETVNTLEAWLGTLPGHRHPNVRRPLLHTLNLADLIPISAKWPGLPHNPSPFFPPGSPPLLHAATDGATPFRLNLHVCDVGHTLIFGPTGAGKSVLLGLIAAQWLRYERAQIAVFDKGRSMFALASACGAACYDFDADSKLPGLCPLAELTTDGDAAWAQDWIAACYELQSGHAPTPEQKGHIHRAITLMCQTGHDGRTLTDFLTTVQDAQIRAALQPYTLGGPMGALLDGRANAVADHHFGYFEIDALMQMGPANALPVLSCLFRLIERRLDGRPSLIILDEAWLMLSHPAFARKLRDWLKTLRKANCAVVMATQSLSDAARSGMMDVLLESCPTRILLPNEEADKPGTDQMAGPRDLYQLIGLNDREIETIRLGRKKRDYYAISPEGRRQFELGLGPAALAFLGASGKEDLRALRQYQALHGENWPEHWLKKHGVSNG